MRMRRAVAARLMASVQDEAEIESGALDEVRADLRALGIDPSRSITLARQQAVMAATPAALPRDGRLDRSVGASDVGGAAAVPADQAQTQASRRRRYDWLSPAAVVGLLRVADGVVVVLAAVAAGFTRLLGTKMDLSTEAYATVLAVLLTIHVFQFAGLYNFERLSNLFGQLGRLLVSWGAVMLGLLALGFMTKMTKELGDTSRLWVGLWFVYGFFGLFTVRLLLKQQIQSWQQSGRLTRSVVVCGAGIQGQRLIEHVTRHGDRAVRIIGVFDDRHGRVPDRICGVPVRGSVDDLLEFGRTNQIDQVIVALPSDAESRRLSWISKLRNLPVDVLVCPHTIVFQLPYRQVAQIAGVPMLHVFEKPLTGWNYIVKSTEDRVLAAGILIMILPLVLLISALIKLGSRGPVLLKQKRYGFNNEVIEVYRFRTMYVGQRAAEQIVRPTEDDPRVTRIGRFLRRTSLDELPQFLNVLMGTMSIVGPRPPTVANGEAYSRLIDEYLGRHRVKPGITGWAQVNGLRGETATLDKMEQRVRFDLYYIENWSLLFDLRIIFRTLLVGFSHRCAS